MAQADKKHMQELFQQSQTNVTSHERLLKQMKQLYEKMPEKDFLTGFIHCLQVPLIHGEKHRVVENTLHFASKFIVTLLQTKPANAVQTEEDDEEEEICPFVLNVLQFLFESHNSEHQAIRFRVCQFINKILNGLGNEACMDDKLCDRISECMMDRLQDKAPAVRMQAILALHRLQDPLDGNCPVMKAFMFHMAADPSADVRRAVVTNIAITTQSIRSILERTHDIKDSVRRTAYINLSKLGVQRFTINQRVRLLTDGLKDRSAIVRDSVSKIMLPSWLQYYKGSFLSLLHALDCENATEISSLALQALFKSEPIKTVLEELTKLMSEDKVISVENLSPENVLYWRCLVEYLDAHPEIADDRPIDEPLPELLPELSTFCNYIRQFYEVKSVEQCEDWVRLQHQYILIQLLELCKTFDLSDEMGRTNLQNLCLYLLTNNSVSEDVVPVVVQLMAKIIPNVEDCLQALAEAISEVREPMTDQEPEPVPAQTSLSTEEIRQRELKQASIRVKINELKEEQDDAIRDQDFMRAQNLKEEYQKLQAELKALTDVQAAPPSPQPRAEIRDVVNYGAALAKCLRIVKEMVQSDSVKCLSATLRSLMQNFVLPCLQEDNSSVIRNKALEALGLFCLLDRALAEENFLMFCFQIANDEVCEVALKVTFDLLLLYGLETFQIREDNGEASAKKKSKKKKNLFVTDMYDDDFDTEEEENQETHTSISSGSSGNTSNLISMLTSLLDSASTSMRNLAMEGLYKLLMACRITSSALLSRLILMWYSPVTDGDESLRQPLGVFLTVYASHCPRSQETLEQAFLPTLRTLMQAPVTSPLTQIDQDSVTRLFVNLTRPGINKFHSKMSHIHNNLAISICNAVMDSDDATNISALLRALSSLELSLDDSVYREELKTLVKRVKEVFRATKEKLFLRYLDKITQQIDTAAETVAMRTTDVDNTAVSSQLDGTQKSVNNTVESETAGPPRQNKNSKLLNAHMHTLISENDIDEEDEEEENSQKTPTITSDIVIPPSPPRSQTSDEEDEQEEIVNRPRKQQKMSEDSSNDHVFKKPAAKVKETPRNRGRQQTKISSESDTSAAAKRRKPSNRAEAQQSSEKAQSVKSTKNHKALDEDSTSDDQAVSGADLEPPKKKIVRGSENSTIERISKRQISPTEKGASLKTFQNISSSKAQSSNSPSRSQTPVKSPRATPPAKRMKKAPQKASLEAEVDSSLTAEASGTSSSGSPQKTTASRPSTRRSTSFQSDNDSLESPPVSAAQLRLKKDTKALMKKSSPEKKSSDSDMSSPSARRRSSTRLGSDLPKADKKGSGDRLLPSSKSSESDSSPLPKRGRQARMESSGTPPSQPATKKGDTLPKRTGSKTDSDDSPLPGTRSGRLRRDESSPAEPPKKRTPASKSSEEFFTATDTDSSPLPARKQRRLRGKDDTSPSQTESEPKSSKSSKSVSSDSEASPAPARPSRKGREGNAGNAREVKGIKKIVEKPLPGKAGKATRRSVSQSDSEGALQGVSSPDPSPGIARTRRSIALAEDRMQSSDSLVSATDLKRKLEKKAAKKLPHGTNKKSSEDEAVNSDASPSPRKSSRGASSQVAEVIPKPGKKRAADVLMTSSSEGVDSDSPLPSSKGSRSRGKTEVKSSKLTPIQPEKKTRTKTPSKDSPVTLPERRSLRSQTETPSPRTRSGKI